MKLYRSLPYLKTTGKINNGKAKQRNNKKTLTIQKEIKTYANISIKLNKIE